jgi:hypothetical protein
MLQLCLWLIAIFCTVIYFVHTHIYTHTHTDTNTDMSTHKTHIQTQTHTNTQYKHTQTHTHTKTHTQTDTHKHTYIYTQTHTHTHKHTHTYTHTVLCNQRIYWNIPDSRRISSLPVIHLRPNSDIVLSLAAQSVHSFNPSEHKWHCTSLAF